MGLHVFGPSHATAFARRPKAPSSALQNAGAVLLVGKSTFHARSCTPAESVRWV